MKKLTAIIISAFIVLFIFLSLIIEQKLTGSVIKSIEGQKLVTKVIDGDTVVVEGGYPIRLLGIDADEKGYPCYEAAKQRLEELVLNKKVYLESDKKDQDQYKRYLRYLILDNENINLKLVKEGLVIARLSPENVKYREEITAAEKEARENRIGCKWGGLEPNETQWSKLTSNITGLRVINACDARNYIGKEKIVEGQIVDGYKSRTNTVFLNFEKPYPNQCFTAVIFSSNLVNFPENPQNYYKGKIVRVRGIIKEYEGKPEIILKNSSQIEIGK